MQVVLNTAGGAVRLVKTDDNRLMVLRAQARGIPMSMWAVAHVFRAEQRNSAIIWARSYADQMERQESDDE